MRFISLFISVICISACANSWYLGEWRVTDAEFPCISAVSVVEAQEWFGSEAKYSESHFAFRGATCDRPSYELQVLSEQDFQMAYRAVFSQLDIDGEATEALRVTCSDLSVFPGMTLIKMTGDAVYLPWDGAFYRLDRIAP